MAFVVLALGAAALVARRREPRAAAEARRAFSAGHYAEAGRALAEWRRTNPNSPELCYLEARTAFALNAPKHEVEEAFRRAKELGCPGARLALLRALGEAKVRQYAKAEPVLRQAFLAQREPDPQIDQELARLYIETFNIRNAGPVLERWARDAPDDPRPYLWRVEIHRRDGSTAGVIIEDYRKVLERDPDSAPARLGLADELRKQHRAEEARAEYEAYLKLKPDDPAGYLGAGRNARELGQSDEAARHFDKVLTLDPRNADAFRERADVALRQGDDTAALKYLDHAVALDPFEVEARHTRGLVLARLGRREDAEREQAASKRLREELGQLDALKLHLIDRPNDPDIEVEIARWMIDHGHDAEGARWAEKVVRNHPAHPQANRLLADYHDRLGNAGRANFYRLNAGAKR